MKLTYEIIVDKARCSFDIIVHVQADGEEYSLIRTVGAGRLLSKSALSHLLDDVKLSVTEVIEKASGPVDLARRLSDG